MGERVPVPGSTRDWKRTQTSFASVAQSVTHEKLPPLEDLWQLTFSNKSPVLSLCRSRWYGIMES